ncbi:unnamed protein product [Cyclocybe aegerita]|uniref:Integrase catalytic domain-containing protein n=1 Tax=Cyclocybe aegerita TaxID=1973307 RepID=A0A8S0W126_CYCAE|nr:unnamed protein product [Cyclocybe aegerita]
MPLGKGGFTKLSLTMDVYSQRLWATKMKKATGKTSVVNFSNICNSFMAPETLMVDGGPENDNQELRDICESYGMELHILPAYSPWMNGLLEGMNGKLLGRLKRLCAPDVGEDEYEKMGWKDLPKNWPDYLEAAVRYLNNRILPDLKYSPNELLLALVINTCRTPAEITSTEVTEADVVLQMAYADQHHLDGYSQIVEHAQHQKAVFDATVTARAPREVIFKADREEDGAKVVSTKEGSVTRKKFLHA